MNDSRAWALSAAVWLAALEATVLIARQVELGGRTAPFVIALLAVKYPFCWATGQRRPGAYLALWLWEISGAGFAIVSPHLGAGWRGLELVLAGICIALVAAAPLFPSPRLPAR